MKSIMKQHFLEHSLSCDDMGQTFLRLKVIFLTYTMGGISRGWPFSMASPHLSHWSWWDGYTSLQNVCPRYLSFPLTLNKNPHPHFSSFSVQICLLNALLKNMTPFCTQAVSHCFGEHSVGLLLRFNCLGMFLPFLFREKLSSSGSKEELLPTRSAAYELCFV